MTKSNGTLKLIDMPATDDGWVIDLNRIKSKEMAAFRAEYKRAEDAGDDSILDPWLAKTVLRWPFPGDPTDLNSYGELGLIEHAEALAHFMEAFQGVRAPVLAAAKRVAAGDQGRSAGTPDGTNL